MKKNSRLFRVLAVALCMGMLTLQVGCMVSDKQVMAQASEVHQGLEPAVVNDPELSTYIENVGHRLIEAAKIVHESEKVKDTQDSGWMFSDAMQFHMVASETLNAFTTGGTHMYIYTGLFQDTKSEAELAAVMSHEFAHVYARHVSKGMARQQYALVGAAAAGAAGYALGDDDKLGSAAGFAGAAGAVGSFLGMGYGREDEREADRLGFSFYVQAGYDPKEFSGFFKNMIKQGHDSTPEMLSTHPSLQSRVDEIDKRVEDLPANIDSHRRPPEANAARYRQLQSRSKTIVASMPKDQTLQEASLLASAIPNHMLPVQDPQQQQAQFRLERYLQKRNAAR